MLRTPSKNAKSEKAGPSVVRRSVGEIEARMTTPTNSLTKTPNSAEKQTSKLSHNITESKVGSKAKASTEVTTMSPKQQPTYKNRTAEAKACLVKAKLQLANSRNLKTDIKADVLGAIERLYALVKEAEGERVKALDRMKGTGEGRGKEDLQTSTPPQTQEDTRSRANFANKLEEHSRLLQEHREEMAQLQHQMRTQHEAYASVAARPPSSKPREQAAMHSVVVTSEDEQETGEQVLETIRKVVNAREVGVRIDRVRQARDRKVIIGCRNREEINKVKDRIKGTGGKLSVEDVQNKDPLVIFYGVLKTNTDDDIRKALKTQNGNLLGDLNVEVERIDIRYRRKARNVHIEHVVARVPPLVWKRLTEAGAVHIDIQRIRVADQSPLVQCSRCLGYGHGKRFCREEVVVCSHCGGAHTRIQCESWKSAAAPDCINCSRSKMEYRDHSAFSGECPVRRKWEALARSAVAYC